MQSDEAGDDENGVHAEPSTIDQRAISDKNVTKLARVVFGIGETVASLFFTTFGAVFAIGIILNLSGYGYQFSLSEGVRIDTLDEMRLERQLERDESVQAKVSEDIGLTQTSKLIEFCYRQPFTASLVLTGVAVAYEEVVKVPLARRKQEEDNIP